MFTYKIETIIYSGVATIGGNILFQKGLTQLAGPGLMMRGNYTQRNQRIYPTFETQKSKY